MLRRSFSAGKGAIFVHFVGVEKKFSLPGLHQGMLEREKIGSIYSSPAPLNFVAVCVLKNPVVWNEEGNCVQVVIMLHIGKNNPRSFRLWDYFAKTKRT